LARQKSTAYARSLALAFAEWEANQVERAEAILDGQCDPDLRHWEWHYLKRLCHPELRTLENDAPVRWLAYSPDGKHLAVSGPRRGHRDPRGGNGQGGPNLVPARRADSRGRLQPRRGTPGGGHGKGGERDGDCLGRAVRQAAAEVRRPRRPG